MRADIVSRQMKIAMPLKALLLPQSYCAEKLRALLSLCLKAADYVVSCWSDVYVDGDKFASGNG